jgi:hypothetical protein
VINAAIVKGCFVTPWPTREARVAVSERLGVKIRKMTDDELYDQILVLGVQEVGSRQQFQTDEDFIAAIMCALGLAPNENAALLKALCDRSRLQDVGRS